MGIDLAQIVRTDPPPNATGFETTRYPCIEFNSPALCWTVSAWPVANGTLLPWLHLVVVKMQDGVTLGAGPRDGTSVLTVAAPAQPTKEFLDPAMAGLWAHVQVAGTVAPSAVADIDATQPERTLSRLLCPRPLEAHETYYACVVPTTEAGRLAGLGQDPGAADGPWHVGAEVVLPAYHWWRFTTGETGDFQHLAAQLEGRVVPGLGEFDLDASDANGSQTLTARGALQPASPDPLPDQGDAVRQTLAAAITPPAGQLPLPEYGAAWQAPQPIAPDAAGWFAELNLDPRWRLAAALGTSVIQSEQEDLVAAAWDQAGDSRGVNTEFDRGALARQVAGTLTTTRLAALSDESLVRVTAPAHGRLVVAGSTVAARLAATSDAARWTPAYRRLASRDGLTRAAEADLVAAASLAPSADLDPHLRFAILHALDANTSVPERVLARVQLPQAGAATGDPGHAAATASTAADTTAAPDALQPAQVAPTFPAPMATHLAEIAADMLLAGADDVPPDTVAIARTNPAFVAAFMIGLNTEMGRELVWRNFPLRRSATFFRYFWDARGQAEGTPDLVTLGSTSPAARLDSLVQDESDIVLVIRSELLRRYPNVLIYAVPASADGSPDYTPGAQRLATFSGTVGTDVRYFGFPLSAAAATGADGGQAWFFVLQEQLTQTRFGAGDSTATTSAQFARDHLRPAERVVIPAQRLVPR